MAPGLRRPSSCRPPAGAPVAVPNVVNLTQAAATTALGNAGLTLGTVSTASSTTVPAGSVISQNPAAGTLVAPGSAVALVVSSGPPATLASLTLQPTSVTGGSASTGTVTLSAAAPAGGAVVTLSSNPTGVVTLSASVTVLAGGTTATFPVTTSPVTTSTTVTITATLGGATRTATLTVTPPPPPVAVPNVVNLTQAAATTALGNAGLTLGTVSTASSTTVPAGSVISQTPAAGTLVAPGSAVALVVSSGPPPLSTTYHAQDDFSGTQGYRNWYYLYGSGTPMTFDATAGWWRGNETYLVLWNYGGHPGNGSDAIRRWVAPQAGSVRITGNAWDDNPGCGGGVTRLHREERHRAVAADIGQWQYGRNRLRPHDHGPAGR